MNTMIQKMLKDGPEQTLTVGPLVERLLSNGWKLDSDKQGIQAENGNKKLVEYLEELI